MGPDTSLPEYPLTDMPPKGTGGILPLDYDNSLAEPDSGCPVTTRLAKMASTTYLQFQNKPTANQEFTSVLT